MSIKTYYCEFFTGLDFIKLKWEGGGESSKLFNGWYCSI